MDELEQHRGAARRLGLVPPVAGADQHLLWSGDRDVGQPVLLDQAAVLACLLEPLQLLLERVAVGRTGPVQRRQCRDVTAQLERQRLRLLGPVGHRLTFGGEHLPAHPRDGDDPPLEPLRCVHGHHPDPLAGGSGLVHLQPVLLLAGGLEVGEELDQPGVVTLLHEVVGLLDESVEVGERVDVVGRPGRELHVETGGPGHVRHQVGQRLPGPAPQVAQLVASGHQPGVSLVAVGRTRSEVVQGVDDAALVDDVVLGHLRVGVAGRHLVGRRVGRRLVAGGFGRAMSPPGQQRGALAEPGEVARPEAPPRTTQQPQQRRAGRGIAKDLQGGDDVGHLGAHQQAAEADDLDRHAPLAQRLLEAGEGGALPAQDGHLAPGNAAVVRRDQSVGHQRGLLGDRLDECALDVSGAGPAGSGNERALREPVDGQPRRDGVRDGQDGLAVAERLGETALAVAAEVGAEPLEVAGTRAPPAVDGLARVADRGDTAAAAEQGREQNPLGLTGVLVFVEEHRTPSGLLDRHHLVAVARQLRRQCDLVAVVDDAALAFQRGVGLDHRQQLAARPLHLREGQRRRPGHHLLCRVDPRAHPSQVLGQVGRRVQVLGQVAGQSEDVLHDGGRHLVDGVERSVVGLDDPPRELPGHGLADDLGGRLEAEPQRVLVDQSRGIGVVGGHPGLAGAQGHRDVVAQERVALVGDDDPAQHAAHPQPQLAGGFAGEREAEHAVWWHQPVGHQPQHAQGHRLGLARPCPGDDRQRLEGCLDRRHLLGRRLVVAQAGRELVGGQISLGARVFLGDLVERQQQLAHDACSPSAGPDGPVTSRPSSTSGQLLRTGQWLQCLFSAATNAEPAIRSAAAVSISSAQAGLS